MHTITSLHASEIDPDQLSALVADSLALEHARVFRQLLVKRCALIAASIAAGGLWLGWLPRFASWLGTGLFLVAPACAWFVERSRERRLAHRLGEAPQGASLVHDPRV